MTVPPDDEGHGGPPRCGARTRAGGSCQQIAGWGTDHAHVPGTRCRLHGGSTPNQKRSAERLRVEQEATAAVVRFGLDMTDITPGEALLREVRRSAAMVGWLAWRVAQLEEQALTWGLTKRKVKQDAEGQQVVEAEQEARQNIWVIMLREERLLLAKVAAEAARSGIEERLARQVEFEGAIMVRLLNAVLGDPELGLTALQRAAIPNVVPRHLRAMDSAA